MAVMWAYPWSFLGDRSTASFDRLASRGVEAANVASHYHSIRTLDPRRDERLFESHPGGCYFEPSPEQFADTPIAPPVNDVAGSDDPLGDVMALAADAGVAVNAWLVCNHNSRLGAENPEYRFESAFGSPHDHALCPSHPEVRAYFAGVAGSLAECGVEEIQLESVGFPNAFHGHGSEFGHDKNQSVTGTDQELLLSQCFCSGCRAAAADHPVDFDRAKAVVREECKAVLEGPNESADLAALREEHPVVDDLFDFRTEVIESFVSRLAEASDDVPLNYYVADGFGHDPGDGWPAGVELNRLEPHLDRVTALCYVGDPEVARRRVEDLDAAVDLPLDAGVCVDPEVVGSKTEWQAVVGAVRDRCSNVHVYNQSLLTDEQVGWLGETFG
ncbi:alpha-amylase family protein [Halorussus amylolyticus]|uniref:hypothetical protein n=1 Tax=Halorussus amylolyticus TaxID=1126242 RepID=UPI00104FDC6F|nr:hypothetical protein [Halorussus amylolyticus]